MNSHSILLARYRGLFLYHQCRLADYFVQSEFMSPNFEELQAVLQETYPIWGMDGSFLSTDYTHLDLYRRYNQHRGTLTTEDANILSSSVEFLKWLNNYIDLINQSPKTYAKVDQTSLTKGTPVFHSYLELPQVREVFDSTLGQYPGILDFLETVLMSDNPYSVDLLKAFDLNFTTGLGTEFNDSMLRWASENGWRSWWVWYKSHYSKSLKLPTGAIPANQGWFEITNQPRDFVSFPLSLVQVDSITPTSLGLYPAMGYAGNLCSSPHNSPGYVKIGKGWYGGVQPFHNPPLQVPLLDITSTNSSIPPDVVTRYSVPSDYDFKDL